MIEPRSARAEGTRSGLRRLNRASVLPVLVVVGAVVTVKDSRDWWDVVLLGAGVVTAAVAFWRWAADDVMRVAVPCLTVTALVWPLTVALTESPGGSYGLATVASLVIPQLRRHRIAAAVAVPVFIAVVGAGRFLVSEGDDRLVLLRYVVVPAGIAVVVIGLMFPNKGFYDHVKDVEARERDAELAVTRERVRFATELHDIQGHTLHVVKLKTALAQRLVRTDPDRAAEELREIHGLVSDTITQTKELAYAQRRLNLSAELENAKNLFEAAGIDVRVTRQAEVDAACSELLGRVLRETTTNILRHAQATTVRIVLAERGITIENDGARPGPPPELRGLAALRERVRDAGGDLVVTPDGDRFTTAATCPGRETR